MRSVSAVKPHGPEGKVQPGLCEDDVGRLIAAMTVREWRPSMEEPNLEARQYGLGVSGEVGHVALGSPNTPRGRRLDHTDRRA